MPARTRSSPTDTAQRTRERLLDAAERLFAERGFRGVSMRALTSEAACNLASVNYHFGGKRELYRAMFHRILTDLRVRRIAGLRRAAVNGGAASLERTLDAFTSAFLEPHLDQSAGRRLMRLFSRELLDPHLAPGTLRREIVEPVRQALAEAIRAAYPRIDPRAARRCAHSLVAQLAHVVQMRNLPGAMRDPALRDLSLDRAVDHIVRFSAAGIRGYVA